jgi:predicted membrane protein
MAHPLTSRKRAKAFSAALFLICLAALILTEQWVSFWWPGIMLVIGLPMALRQYLLGRTYDTIVTLLVFVGTFVTVEFDISWKIFLPIIFTLGALYILLREAFEETTPNEAQREEDVNHEIDENKKH